VNPQPTSQHHHSYGANEERSIVVRLLCFTHGLLSFKSHSSAVSVIYLRSSKYQESVRLNIPSAQKSIIFICTFHISNIRTVWMNPITSNSFSFVPLLLMVLRTLCKWSQSSLGYVVADVSASVANMHMQPHGRWLLQHRQR
jgi:hypothetical protein